MSDRRIDHRDWRHPAWRLRTISQRSCAGRPGSLRHVSLRSGRTGPLAVAICLLSALGCAESLSDPAPAASLSVRIAFPDAAGGHPERPSPKEDAPSISGDAGGSTVSLTEIGARAIELGDANVVRDQDSASLTPSDERFRLSLVVPPAQYYRVEVDARGTRTTNGATSEPGPLYFGQGFAMNVSAETDQTVEVLLQNLVPVLSGNVTEGELFLSWTAVPEAVRYRIKERIGETVIETAIARTDTTLSVGSIARSFRVRAELENGLAGAYSEALATGAGSGGDLRITVVDARTGEPLANARVTVLDRSQVTNSQGIAEFAGLPLGQTTVRVTLDGYVQGTTEVTILAGRIVPARVAISETLAGGFRIVLTWGEEPLDLDSYLVTPLIEGEVHTIYFENQGSETEAPFAYLDHDTIDGFGPETITILQSFPGVYRYYVHNYSRSQDPGAAPLAGSGARVELIREDRVINSVVVPATGRGDYWNVLTLDPESATVVVLNEMSETPPALAEPVPAPKRR